MICEAQSVVKLLPHGSLDVYAQHGQTTRQRKFISQGNIPTLSTTQHLKLATVFPTHLNGIISFHSSAFKPITFQPPTSSVLNLLKSLKNPCLWDTFECDGDGWWIRDALISGSLFMVSNRSYLRHRHAGACSGAFVLYCSKTQKMARFGWAELQVKSNNYCTEILGAVGFLLVIRAVLSDKASKSLLRQRDDNIRAKTYSDCMGVISHGNNLKKNLQQNQVHVDLICLIRTLVCELAVFVYFIYVRRHQDNDIPQYLLTQEQKLNVDMDTLAKKTLRHAIRNSHYIDSDFPCEPLRLSLQGRKVFCSPTKALEEAFSRCTAHFFYDSKKSSHR